MIVYPMYVIYDHWLFCLVATATLDFKKRDALIDNFFKTTEAVWL